jgi:transposase-like protein
MERIPASERTREKLKALTQGRGEVEDRRSELVRLAVRLIIEEALEGEARDAVGREYYARGAKPGAGYRNGYRSGSVQSAESATENSAPQIADRHQPFWSIREAVHGRTEELEALAVEMYARGLSTRDIEALFADGDGRTLLSRSAVSEITEPLWA